MLAYSSSGCGCTVISVYGELILSTGRVLCFRGSVDREGGSDCSFGLGSCFGRSQVIVFGRCRWMGLLLVWMWLSL